MDVAQALIVLACICHVIVRLKMFLTKFHCWGRIGLFNGNLEEDNVSSVKFIDCMVALFHL
jgi:hypothetical protein